MMLVSPASSNSKIEKESPQHSKESGLNLRTSKKTNLQDLDRDQFVDFVQQVFTSTESRPLRFGENKDGGIDIAIIGTDRLEAIQCKFITGKTNSVKSAWQKEAKKLSDVLKTDHDGKLLAQSQYLPWSNTQQPIVTYIFCYNFTSVNLQQFNNLKRSDEHLRVKIQNFFCKQIAARRGFAHISKIEVRVLSGDSLLAMALIDPVLTFKVFGPEIPLGFEPIGLFDEKNSLQEGFQKCLSDRAIKYFSREAFLASATQKSVVFDTETKILKDLFDTPDEEPILLITGPGGYGKSRLSIEICKMVGLIKKCVTYRIDDDVDADAVSELARTIPNGVTLVLWIEYIETQRHFQSIISRAARLNTLGVASVRIIGNCRKSFFKSELSDTFQSVIDISSIETGLEFEYRKAVFKHIIKQAGYNPSDNFSQECGHNPVLAALMAYISSQEDVGENLREEIKKLVENPKFARDISSWLVSKILRSYNSVNQTISRANLIENIAGILMILPATDSVMELVNGDKILGGLLKILIADRIVEKRRILSTRGTRVRIRWAVAHDIVADYFLGKYLSDTEFLEAELRQLLRLAAKRNAIWSTILSLQRVDLRDRISSNSWHKLFSSQINENFGLWSPSRASLIKTNLLSPRDKILLLVDNAEFFDGLANEPLGSRAVTGLAYLYAKTGALQGSELNEQQTNDFLSFLEQAQLSADDKLHALGCALRFAPERFESRALEAIALDKNSTDQYHLFCGWLHCGLRPRNIEEPLSRWLLRYCTSSNRAALVIWAWLSASYNESDHDKAEDNLFFISEFLKEWIEHNSAVRDFEARFVFGGWLRLSSKISSIAAFETLGLIEPHLCRWLPRFGSYVESSYVLAAWMRCGATAGPEHAARVFKEVTPFVRSWLDHSDHCFDQTAAYVFSAALICCMETNNGPKECLGLFEKDILNFLLFSVTQSTPFLIHDYLKSSSYLGPDAAKRSFLEVENLIVKWLADRQNKRNFEAHFVFEGWLITAIESGRKSLEDCVERINDDVEEWLNTYRCQSLEFKWMKALRLLGLEYEIKNTQVKRKTKTEISEFIRDCNYEDVMLFIRESSIQELIEFIELGGLVDSQFDGVMNRLRSEKVLQDKHRILIALLNQKIDKKKVSDYALDLIIEDPSNPATSGFVINILEYLKLSVEDLEYVKDPILVWFSTVDAKDGSWWTLNKLIKTYQQDDKVNSVAINWLLRYEGILHTRVVHGALVTYNARKYPSVIDPAIRWVDARGGGTGAADLLSHLVPLQFMRPEIVDFSLSWIDTYPGGSGVNLLAISLIELVLDDHPKSEEIASKIVWWFAHHGPSSGELMVFSIALVMARNKPVGSQQLADAFCDWLERNAEGFGAPKVLRLLKNDDFICKRVLKRLENWELVNTPLALSAHDSLIDLKNNGRRDADA
jgi:hypothetical protein